jgi:hypothetical protein
MKKYLLILVTIFSMGTFAQDWQYIGGEGGLGAASEIAMATGSNNEIFIAKRNGTTISIHTWNGSNWTQVGSNFTTSGTNIQLGIKPGGIPVIAFNETSYIRIYSFEGGSWLGQVPGATPLTSPSSKEFKLFVENGGDIRMTYFNENLSIHNEERTICTYVSPAGVSVVGGEIDQDDAPHKLNTDFIFDSNDEDWVLYDYQGLSDGTSLVQRSGAFWNAYTLTTEASEDAKFVESGDRFLCFYREIGSSTLRLNIFDRNTGVFGGLANIGSSDQDFAVSNRNNNGLVFYRTNTSSYTIKEFNNAYSTINTWSNFGPSGAISELNIVEYSDWSSGTSFPVVAFINGGNVSVMELSQATSINYTSESFCVGNSITTAALNFDDPNYDNTLSLVQVTLPAGSPLSNPNYSGGFPNMQVTFDVDMSSSTNGAHEFTVNYYNIANTSPGNNTQTETFSLNLFKNPEIEFSFPSNEVCTNQNPVNLNNFVSPQGGQWSLAIGPIIPTGFLNPAGKPPGDYTVEYNYTDPSTGCQATDQFDFRVHAAAELSVSTTSSSCGNDDGTATVTVTTNPSSQDYTLYWSNGDVTDLADTLDPGMYYVNVTTDSGCVTMAPAVIDNDDLVLTGITTPALCYGQATGSINMTITGASTEYAILWSNGATTEDITNVIPGPYTVTVTDENGCEASKAFLISSPDQITWTAGNDAPTCGNTDGLAFCETVGGTMPYTWQWFDHDGTAVGSNNDTLENIQGGFYSVLITDDNGCTATWNTAVNEIGGPTIIIDSTLSAGCSDDGAIYTSIDAPAGIQSIEWNSGETTEDITNLAPGFYAISVIDNIGCTGMASFQLNPILPEPVDICLVTVNENTTTNKVVWEKPVSTTISSFNVYRETSQAGLFQLVDDVLYSEETEFTDPIASPQVRSWRYKISSVDLCGMESELSDDHKTIHLTVSQGLGSNINLHWDQYEGISYDTYNIERFDNASGWVSLIGLPISSSSYTDVPPSTDGLDYIVVIDHPGTCTSSKANDYNSSRSNRAQGVFNPNAGLEELDASLIELYPNPSNGQFKLILEGIGMKQVQIISSNGKMIYQEQTNSNEVNFNLSNIEAGMYHLIIQSDDQNIMKKIMIR